MGSELDCLNKHKENLYLVARTGALSPADISIFTDPVALAVITGLTEAIGGVIFDWVKDSIMSRQRERREKNELVRNILGYCRNADFFVGKKLGIPTIVDLKAAVEILRLCIGTFSTKPELKNEEKDEPIEFEHNLVCVGDIKNNPVTEYSFQQLIKELPYHFSRQNEEFLTLTDKSNKILLAPEYYPQQNIIVKDYAAITQVSSLVPNFRYLGRKMLIVSGTTPSGTLGAALAIKERDEVLNQIWAETKGRDFQAILSIDLEDKEPINMSLLEVKQL